MSSVEPAPDVGQADAEFALVGAQHGVGAGQGLEDRVVDMNAGAIHGA